MVAKVQQPEFNYNEKQAVHHSDTPSQVNPFITKEKLANITGTKHVSWSVGQITDSFIYFYANTTEIDPKPGIRYHKAESRWEISNDGVSWKSIAIAEGNFFDKDLDDADNISESSTRRFVTDEGIKEQHLDITNTPIDGYLLSWNESLQKFEWKIDQVGGGTGDALGTPSDGSWEDGLFSWTTSTTKTDALDDVNELLVELVPESPNNLDGSLGIPSVFSGRIAGDMSRAGVVLDTYMEGQSIFTIVAGNNFVKSIPAFGQADKGDLNFFLRGSLVDAFDLGVNFNEAERDGSQTYTPLSSAFEYVSITDIDKFNNFKKWQQGQGLVRVGLVYGNTNLEKGENSYQLKHKVDSVEVGATNVSRIFYDGESKRPSITSTPSVIESLLVGKYLSGVKSYGYGSKFGVGFIAEECFEYTYVDTPTVLTFSGMTTLNMSFSDAAISGVTVPTPLFDEIVVCTNKLITLNRLNVLDIDTRLIVQPRDPFGNGVAEQSISENRLVDTYEVSSDESIEYFVDENRRMPLGDYNSIPGSVVGQWNSSLVLANGNALVFDSFLMYPEIDFSTGYLPVQEVGRDYSGFTGDQAYIRAFKDASGHQGGTLSFNGLSLFDLDVNVSIEIKLPSLTGWLSLDKAYNASTFTGVDGDGCRVSSSGGVFGWTSGVFSTADCELMIILRITFKNNNKQILQITTDWN